MNKLFIPFLVAVCCLLFACGGGESSSSTSSGGELKAGKGGAHYGGVFKINEEEYFRTLYPLNVGEVVGHRITNQIYEGLVALDQADLTLVPSIAEKWTVSDDALTYTFDIRKGVKFHDDPCFADGKGREVTAKDVKYCLDLLCTSSADNKGYDFVKDRIVGANEHWKATAGGKKVAGGVSGIKIINDNQIEIKLSKPFSSFLYILAMPFGFVFPEEAVTKYGKEMRDKTVGTGPFMLKTVKENEAVIMLRNPNYWKKDKNGNQLPFLDGVRFSFIKEMMSALREFKKGNADLIYRPPLEMMDEIADRQGNLKEGYKQYQYQARPSMDVQYYGFLNTGELFKDKKLRQAFCYAVDREKLIDFTLKGGGVPAHHGIVPPSFSGYNTKGVKGYSFDANKARTLMAQAGYPDGKGFPELTLNINSGGGRNEQVAEAVQKMLSENLNIKVNISKMPFHQHLENTESGKFDFWRAGWIADYPDPENFLTLLWSDHLTADIAKGTVYLNTFRFKSPKYDKLFTEALRTVDDKKRNELFRQAEQIAANEAPFLPLYHSKDVRLLQGDVRNFPQNSMEYRLLGETYFVPE